MMILTKILVTGETKDLEIEKKGGEIQALTSTLETAKVPDDDAGIGGFAFYPNKSVVCVFHQLRQMWRQIHLTLAQS